MMRGLRMAYLPWNKLISALHGVSVQHARVLRPFGSVQSPLYRHDLSGEASKFVKKFYHNVNIEKATNKNGWSVCLDGRALKTPAGNEFILPTEKAANLIAAEWENQKTDIDFSSMLLSSLAVQALDLINTGDLRQQVEAKILKYLATDSTVFVPPDLITAFKKDVRPIHEAIEIKHRLSEPIRISLSLEPPQQNRGDLNILANLMTQLTNWELSCLFNVTRNLKSYLLSIALFDDLVAIEEAIAASSLETREQAQQWGSVEEAQALEDSRIRALVEAAMQLRSGLISE